MTGCGNLSRSEEVCERSLAGAALHTLLIGVSERPPPTPRSEPNHAGAAWRYPVAAGMLCPRTAATASTKIISAASVVSSRTKTCNAKGSPSLTRCK